MKGLSWSDLARPARDSPMWELFHESCRLGRKDRLAPEGAGAAAFGHLADGLAYETYPETELPAPEASESPGDATSLPLAVLSALLAPADGVPAEEGDEHRPRSRSLLLGAAGAVQPLEIYLHASYVEGLDVGLYHYQASGRRLRHLRRNDHSHKIASALPDPQSVRDASVMLLLAAVPERATARWGERGYRLTLLEVGAVARDLELRGRALGLECRHFGEYRDREVDELLDCDGLCLSIVHMLAFGRPVETASPSSPRPPEDGYTSPGGASPEH